MTSTFLHTNFNVFDLEKSLAFYQKALGLTESRRINASDGSFIIVYLTDHTTDYQLELTWLRDRKQPYNLGDNEIHLAVRVPDKKEAHALHEEMDASVLKIKKWICTLFPTPTDIGLRSWTAKKQTKDSVHLPSGSMHAVFCFLKTNFEGQVCR